MTMLIARLAGTYRVMPLSARILFSRSTGISSPSLFLVIRSPRV